jgi:hypothetical protein
MLETCFDGCQPLPSSLSAEAVSGEAAGRDTAAASSKAHFVVLTAHPFACITQERSKHLHAPWGTQRSALNPQHTYHLFLALLLTR